MHTTHAHLPGDACNDTPSVPFAKSGHSSTVWSLSFSPTGEHLVSSSEDTTLRIWRRVVLKDGELPDRNKVYRIGKSDKERWDCVGLISGVFERSVYSVDWEPAASQTEDSLGRVVAAGADGKIVVFELVSVLGRQRSGSAKHCVRSYEAKRTRKSRTRF